MPRRKPISDRKKKRRRRALILDINRFIEGHPEDRLCPGDIKYMVDKYREWTVCSLIWGGAIEFARKVLYYVFKRMYWSGFQESNYVEFVLRSIYEVDKSTTAILQFLPVTQHINRYHVIYQYVLTHAYKQKMLFNGYRLPQDTFLMMFYRPNPPILLEMLKFGAMFSPSRRSHEECLLKLALPYILKENPDLLPLKDLQLDDLRSKELYAEFLACCELILKDSAMLPLDGFLGTLRNVLRIHLPLEEFLQNEAVKYFFRKFSENLIDGFENHFIVTLSLQQTARLVIRRRLNENWRLPYGIQQLPIPELLKRYLDI